MIDFDAVTKRYPGGSIAVNEFSASFPSRSITVLLGSSGCGKTTLLRMVNRMVTPSSGRVIVGGRDVAGENPVKLRRSIGYVMQNAGLLPHHTVMDNIATVPVLNGVAKSIARDHALELMDRVGLMRDLADRYPAQLSGGQAQRVGVARALAADPDVLLMDEPFGAVDPLVRRELQNELLRLQAELGKTILFVTHDVDEALTLGDEILLLQEGAAVAQRGAGRDILTSPANDFVRGFMGLDSAARELNVERHGTQSVVTDSSGRTIGVVRERNQSS